MHGHQNIKICALSWSIAKIILRCTVSKTSKDLRVWKQLKWLRVGTKCGLVQITQRTYSIFRLIVLYSKCILECGTTKVIDFVLRYVMLHNILILHRSVSKQPLFDRIVWGDIIRLRSSPASRILKIPQTKDYKNCLTSHRDGKISH